MNDTPSYTFEQVQAMLRERAAQIPDGPPDSGNNGNRRATGTAKDEPQGVRCMNYQDFMGKAYPPRKMLLSPVIPRQGLCMLYAPRGGGKTFASLSIAHAVASGGGVFGRWNAPEPARVLFIDGEMPAVTLQERLRDIAAGSVSGIGSSDMLRIITPDEQDGPMPNLATAVGQDAVEPFLAGVDLVVLDNLATLVRGGRANDEESWLPVQTWLLGLRRRGIAVLCIHHAGKGGDQRGTSAKEDVLDTVISLRRPADYKTEEGARFEIHFTKARGLCGTEANPFEAVLRPDASGGLVWHTRDLEVAKLDQLRQLLADGCTVRDAAEEMGVTKSTVDRWKKKLALQGGTK